jgi:tetratricopeptide (TPR) repeat protein
VKKGKSASSIIARAMAEYKAKDYEAALVTLSAAPVDENDYLDLAYLLGLCHVRLERFDEALLYLEQVVTSGGEDERTRQCRLTLAYVYSITGRTKLAEYELRKLLESEEGLRFRSVQPWPMFNGCRASVMKRYPGMSKPWNTILKTSMP